MSMQLIRRGPALPALVQLPVPAIGLGKERNNLTPLLRSAGRLLVNCEQCGLEFSKPIAWMKRTAHHYCGIGCSAASRIKRVFRSCAGCGTLLLVTPSTARNGYGVVCGAEACRKDFHVRGGRARRGCPVDRQVRPIVGVTDVL
jgi:hypothetical protein